MSIPVTLRDTDSQTRRVGKTESKGEGEAASTAGWLTSLVSPPQATGKHREPSLSTTGICASPQRGGQHSSRNPLPAKEAVRLAAAAAATTNAYMQTDF